VALLTEVTRQQSPADP